jgi:alcohol dehydrogenase (cytochrome c)
LVFARAHRALNLPLGIAGLLAALGTAAAQQPTKVSGAKAYAEHCAACHGPNFGGGVGPSVGPPLRGAAFEAKWKAAAPGAFLAYIRQTMPLNQPGGLDDATYAAVSDYIRAANHLPPEPAATAASKPAPASNLEVIAAATGSGQPREDAESRAAQRERQALAARMAPVTEAMLRDPPAEDWLAWRRTQSTLGYSPLKQIDRNSVGRLGLAWSFALGTGSNAIAPLVHDGVLFVNSNGTVRALDATNGDVLWTFARPVTTTRVPINNPRNLTLFGDALYVPTLDSHVIALDARSGKVLWDHEIGKPEDQLQLTAAPIAVRGKIVQGVAGCQGGEYAGGCYIVALDAASGKELWRFNTIARPGQPGGDSWNGAPVEKRFGGSVWTTPSYDPETNLLYFGVGQTYVPTTLLEPQGRPGQSRDALYTDTTLALDPDSGKLVWFYQHAPADVWDLDWAFERSIITLPLLGGPRKVVVTSGKTAIIDVLDAKTGQYLWSQDMGLQNLVTAIDPKTGRKSYNPALTPEPGKPKLVCPSTIGARNWPATAYDPASGLLYIPLSPNCMNMSLSTDPNGPMFKVFGQFVQSRGEVPDTDGNYGRIAAIDLKARKIAWSNRYRAAQPAAILATAGGVIFEGGRDRWFRSLDSATGKALWQARLDATPNAFPITYSVGGRQYVAVVSGGNTPVELFLGGYTPELEASIGGKTLTVFALPAAAP